MAGGDVEVHSERLDVDRHVIRGLRAIGEDRDAARVSDPHDVGNRIYRPQRVGHVRHRHHPRALGQQRIELVDQELPAVVHRQHAKPGAALLADELPGNDVRVMLHCGDHHFVAWLKRRPDERGGHEVDALGGVSGEDDLPVAGGVEEPPDLRPCAVVRRRRQLTEGVHATVHVRVDVGVVARQRVEHNLRLLRRRRVVEIDEWMTVHLPAQDREISPDALNIERRPRPACSAIPHSGSESHTASISARSLASCAYSSASSARLSGSTWTRSRISPAKAWISMSRASK